MDYMRTCAWKCNEKSTILDIGANDGGYTYTFTGFPHKRILSFEPCPKLAKHIVDRFKDDRSIEVYQVGVSDKEFSDTGYTVFQAWTIGKPGTIKRGISPGAIEIVGKDLFDIKFITIDGLNFIDGIDFIKLDVDGYELRVLRGAEKTIQKFRPGILIEISYMVDDIGDSVEEFLDFIYDALKYRLYTCEGEERSKAWMKLNFPWHTSYDMMMLPSEVELKDIEK